MAMIQKCRIIESPFLEEFGFFRNGNKKAISLALLDKTDRDLLVFLSDELVNFVCVKGIHVFGLHKTNTKNLQPRPFFGCDSDRCSLGELEEK